MHRSKLVLFATISVTFLLTVSASAQNLLVNPDFDTDLAGWEGPGVWDAADAFGSPSSGSATWINDYAAGGSTIVRQCVELTPLIKGYDLAAYVFIPSGQPGGGYTNLAVAFYSDTGCNTYFTGAGTQNFSEFDSWTLLDLTGWTPSGAGSARITVVNQKSSSGDFQTYCDAFFFAANPDMLFADGFETMDTSEWSADAGGAV